jgi:hypothetical protein
MSGLFIFIVAHLLKQSRPPAGIGYPSAGLIGWATRAATAVASGSSGPRASPSAGPDHYARDRSTRRRRARDDRSLLGKSGDANQQHGSRHGIP